MATTKTLGINPGPHSYPNEPALCFLDFSIPRSIYLSNLHPSARECGRDSSPWRWPAQELKKSSPDAADATNARRSRPQLEPPLRL
ncbi:hypothetical protein PT974_12599 [Cladobotryum mycophilum]|uniref:Uncharacterized protein n=1 Tax=Cladobotryum mycophilum TaxID=491253 RepID=A0ABR0S8E3_9HYPO